MTLLDKLLIAAVLVQVALTFGLLIWLGSVRVPLVAGGKVHPKSIALSREGWPEHARQIANCVDNQFQLPVLFYVAVVLALVGGDAGWLEVVLAWVFVLTRLAHARVHTTSNRIDHRFTTYTIGLFALIAYWGVIGLRLLLTGVA